MKIDINFFYYMLNNVKYEKRDTMKFSDIDFSALSQMMNNMSDEEKERLNNMAENMMNNMKNEAHVEEVEEITMYEFLNIDEEDYASFGPVLDTIEQAVDIEQYYEDTKDTDFSACIIYYAKAVLNVLRTHHYSIYKNVLQANGFSNPNITTIQSYLIPLMNEENIHLLADEQFGSLMGWVDHKNFLLQLSVLLNRAEYDFISYEDLQTLKQMMFDNNALIHCLDVIQ